MFDRKKGMVNIIYIAGLILIFTISVAYIRPIFSDPKASVVEISINNNIFVMRDSLEMAKMYVDNAARYSLYQSMYDNGLKGGLRSSRFQYKGMNYTVWYNNMDRAPKAGDIIKALEETAAENMEKYTKKESIRSFFIVEIPGYKDTKIENINNYTVRLQASGSSDLQLKNTLKTDEEITVKKSSDINITVYAPYFELYRQALEYHKDVERGLSECDKAVIEKNNEDIGCCTINAKVLETDDGSCLVKAEVATKKKFLIWNGTDTLLEPVKLVFMERLGTVVERCTECLNTPGSWCAQSKKCSTDAVVIECPQDSTIETASCRALEHKTCADCLMNSAEAGEMWVWCSDSNENACAESCAGKTVYNAEDCPQARNI